MSGFDTWWYNEGSEMRPLDNEDMEEFAKRITEIAWRNGAYTALVTFYEDSKGDET
jgi:hypothetical protein